MRDDALDRTAPYVAGRQPAASLSSLAMPARRKLLHLLRFDDWGGTEVQVATLLIHSGDAEWEQAAALLAPPGPIYRALVDGGIQAYSLAGPSGMAGSLYRLIRLLRTHRFDLIQAYGFRAGMIARIAAVFGGRPGLVIGIRGMHFAASEGLDAPLTRFVIAVERALASTVRCYEANSKGAVAFLASRGLPAAKFRVIPNGVETRGVPQASHDPTARPKLMSSRISCDGSGTPSSCKRSRHCALPGPTFAVNLSVTGRGLICSEISRQTYSLAIMSHFSVRSQQRM